MNHWEHKSVGITGECDTVPSGAIWEQAKAILAAKAKAKAERQAKRDAEPTPNRICYAESAYKGWKPGDKIPSCKVCGGLLHPNENHVCDGFKANYVEHTEETKERWEAKREEIRESRRGRGLYCSECNELMADPDEAEWHFEDHGGKPEREHYALDGEPDGDLDGYEDEPEEDYCEGDDDGYDCD